MAARHKAPTKTRRLQDNSREARITPRTVKFMVSSMVKRVHVIFDNDEFEELKRRKDKLGLSRTEVIRKGLECLEREAASKRA